MSLERFDSAAGSCPSRARASSYSPAMVAGVHAADVTLAAGGFNREPGQGSTGPRTPRGRHPTRCPAEGSTPGRPVLERSGGWRSTPTRSGSGCVSLPGRRRVGVVGSSPGESFVTPPAACESQPRRPQDCAALARYERASDRYDGPGPAGGLQLVGGHRLRRRRRRASWSSPRRPRELGAELFVVDDGWFTGRPDDRPASATGTRTRPKFPGGFDRFVEDVRALGMRLRPLGRARGHQPRHRAVPRAPRVGVPDR